MIGSGARSWAATIASPDTTLHNIRTKRTVAGRKPAKSASPDDLRGLARWGAEIGKRGSRFVNLQAPLVLRLHPDLAVTIPGGHRSVQHAVVVAALFFLLAVIVPEHVLAFRLAVVEERLFGLLAVLMPRAIPVVGFALVKEDLLALLPVAMPGRP